tara:strand:+ start:25119 stop:25871 length:753 start_codon:yes stop_codon:yes gene_type:complete
MKKLIVIISLLSFSVLSQDIDSEKSIIIKKGNENVNLQNFENQNYLIENIEINNEDGKVILNAQNVLNKETQKKYNMKYELIPFDELNYQINNGEIKDLSGNISTFSGIIKKDNLKKSTDIISLIKNSKVFNFRGSDILNGNKYIKSLLIPEKYITSDTNIKETIILNKVNNEYTVQKLILEISDILTINLSGNFIYENNKLYANSANIYYNFINEELFNKIKNKYNIKEKEKIIEIEEKIEVLSIINLI